MKRTWMMGLAVSALAFAAAAQDAVRVTDTTDTAAKRNEFYAGNKEPLLPSPLIKLPAGAIKPQGWLRKQLELEADGMIGRLPEISPYCNRKGNAWFSPTGEGNNGWEEVPYWFRGFSALGYAIDDPRIMQETKEWIENVIASQREDGFFGPRSNLKEKGDHDMMPNMFMLFALRSYYEYTGDARILPLMTRFFKWQMEVPDNKFFSGGWQVPRNGDNMDSVYWLYNRTGDAFLLELADKLRRTGTSWMKEPTGGHNVDFSQGWRKPALFYPQTNDVKYLQQAEKNFDTMMDIYGQVPGGLFNGDEFARPGYTDPRNAIETCGIVEMMHSQQILLRVSGDLKWADRCENAAYNSLPAAFTADMKALRYLTSANQISSDRGNKGPEIANSGDMFSMNPFSHRCCQHNAGMGWPYFAENLWQATPGNGLAAIFYSASEVRAKVGTGEMVTIKQTTPYPFDGQVQLAFDSAKPVRFPLYLRVPGWCATPKVTLNGKPVAVQARPGAFICIDRTWAKGDQLALDLPMEVTVQRWEKNKNAASVNRGPLTFSVKIGEQYTQYGNNAKWPAWEITATTPWNYGLAVDPKNPAAAFEVVKKPWPESNMVFTHEGAPVEIRAKVRRVPEWKDIGMGLPGKLQPSPARSTQPVETITLIPMGAGRLRITAMPVVSDAPDAVAWRPTTPMPASYWPNEKAPGLLRDGRIPGPDMRGADCFKWVGWAGYNLGAKVWVRQDFDQEETVTSCEIFWAAEPPKDWITELASWKILYQTGEDEWKEVEPLAGYPFGSNAFARVTFKPVKTRALKIDGQSKDRKTAGIFEWRSWVQAGALEKHSCIQEFGMDIRGNPQVKTVSSSDVSWYVDPRNPKSQLPKSWKILVKQGDTWKEVANASGYGLDPAKSNTVKFDPIDGTAVRLDVYAEPGASAGPREWRVKADEKK